MLRRLGTLPALLLGCGLLLPAGPRAAEIEGVRFAESASAAGERLRLHGFGLLRYKVLFRAYVAALYLGEDTSPEEVLSDIPKRLEIEYFWPIAGEDFGRAADTLLEQRLAPQALAALRPRLDELHALYTDVEPGDRYSLTYAPGAGTELALNGRRLGSVPGGDFAAAYFSLWLGEEPLDTKLRDQLLRGP